MDVSPQEPPLMAMDLSKSYNTRTRSHHADLPKKPEWYHRDLAAPSPASSYRTPASSSFASPSQPAAAAIRCRDMEPGAEPLGGYMNSTITPHLELYGDGVHGNLWHPGFYGPDQDGCPVPESSGGEESDSGSDVIFLVSSAKEPLVCGSFLQDGVHHMVEPLSPAVSSPDDGRGCYHRPPALSSPSPDSSYSEDSSDSSVDIPVHHARPVVLLSDLAAVFGNSAESAVDVSSDDDDSDVVEVAVTNEKQKKRTPPERESSKTPRREVRRSTRIRTSPSDTPPHTGGTRHSLRRRAKNDVVGIYNESCDSDDVMEFAVRASSSDESLPPPSPPQRTGSESGQDVRTEPKSPESLRQASPEKTLNHARKRPLAVCESKTVKRTEQKKKKPAAQCRKKRRPRTGAAAPFPPREPEIQLRFLKAQKQKKEKKSQDFSPFVRMERRTCLVVNYQEDEARSGEVAAARPPTGFVPNTSCFQLGRLGSDPRGPASLRCCLCGHTANTMGLGDLHGPYCPTAAATPGALNGAVQEEQSQERCHGRSVNSAHVSSPSRSPLGLDECWIHEDCGIWSAGVFLVRGKLYGLQEAARLAHDTICSTCHQTGAIMGCFQKGCFRNYHHKCAVQSGCILNEENFSMRCPEHKNKQLTATNRRHRR